MPAVSLRPTGPVGLVVALTLGIGFVAVTFGLSFVLGVSGFWQTDVDDVTQYVAGFNHYFAAPWQFPLLAFDSLDYPQGTRATFVDAIPLYALLLKALLPTSLAPFNPYGVWVALCFILQPVGAWWIARELRINSWTLLIGLALVLLVSPALMARIGHISLMSHWILLFALALYIRGQRLKALPVAGWAVLLLAAFYINIYLFVMAAGIYLAGALGNGAYRHWRSLAAFVLPFGLLLASLFVTLLPLPLAEVTREWGFGFYSMNLLSPLLGGHFLQFQAEVGPGQYEGFNYQGLGLLFAFVIALGLCHRHDRSFFRRHWPLALLMLGYSLYALSNQVYFGSTEVLVIRYPEFLNGLTAQFRASGRFFWAVGYCVAVFSLLTLYRHQGRIAFTAIVTVLVALQLADLRPLYRALKEKISTQTSQQMNYSAWDAALGVHIHTLYFYPKFKCGQYPPHDSLLPIMRYAGERHLNLNTGYIARYTPRCDDIAAEISSSALDTSAFIFVRKEFETLAAVEALLPAGELLRCRELDFAFVCLQPTE
ncbi:DUF6311 domain-containing protein [Ectopseudomonas oleovorans]|uniref:DUF6311 domain-containing protein n=1 Tax=Ectopseudomonas oleovorans TaxID=301 RepID=UPI001F5BBBB6|nr:DUF6311 domain-containing protein [Pseudomonas oleovorans]